MRLYLRIENGQAVDHPMVETNLLEIYPTIDLNNLPEDVVRFVRVPLKVGVYEVYENTTYAQVDGVWQDVHNVRPMTTEEKAARQEKVKQTWLETTNFASWNFSEELCQFVPPVSYPDDGKLYRWDEEKVNWIEVTE